MVLFYTMDLAFRVQDYQWYVHINAKQKAYNHTLKDMQQWIDTIAAPPTLSIKTFMGGASSHLRNFRSTIYKTIKASKIA